VVARLMADFNERFARPTLNAKDLRHLGEFAAMA
jgi:hypothetical protein